MYQHINEEELSSLGRFLEAKLPSLATLARIFAKQSGWIATR